MDLVVHLATIFSIVMLFTLAEHLTSPTVHRRWTGKNNLWVQEDPISGLASGLHTMSKLSSDWGGKWVKLNVPTKMKSGPPESPWQESVWPR